MEPDRITRAIELADLPSEELMEAIDVPLKQYGDFLKAFQLLIHVSQGMTITRAADAVRIERRSIYTEYWQTLISKAKLINASKLMISAQAAANRVVEEWPDLVHRFIARIKDPGSELRDVNAAMEFLYMAYIQSSGDTKKDDSAERAALASGQSYNPMAPIFAFIQQVQEAPQAQQQPPEFIEGQVIDEAN